APGADRLLFSVPLDGDTGYPAVLGDEVDDGGAQPHGHTRAAQSRTQATRECLAHGQLDAFALREPRQPARPEFRQLPSTLRVAGQQADPAVVDLVHRNAQWRITVRRFQVRQLGTECSAV